MPDTNFTTKNLITGQNYIDGTGLNNFYTTPSDKRTLIKEVLISNNTSDVDNTYSIFFVPSGELPDQRNAVLYKNNINSNETLFVSLNTVLDSSEAIFSQIDTEITGGRYVNFKVTGVEIDQS